MSHPTSYLNFIPEVVPSKEKADSDLWFLFDKNKILIKILENTITIPSWEDIANLSIINEGEHYLGRLMQVCCYTSNVTKFDTLPSNLEFRDFRSIGDSLILDLYLVAGKASEIIYWDKTHQYCSKCGTKTNPHKTERAMICPTCGFTAYPVISPAIIVAVSKADELLLAHNNNFPEGLYSTIAGFVEAGETFEHCVKREVYEETGILVKNIKYFTSQPWPFPNSIMIAFTAEYQAGEIKVDGIEIGDANWFKIESMPNLPMKSTVARKLIDNFINSITLENS